MNKFGVISENTLVSFARERRKVTRFQVIKAVRIFYLIALLAFILFLEASQSTFINTSVILPVYGLLSFSFLLNSLYLLFQDKVAAYRIVDASLFAVDAVVIAGFNYFSQGSYSLFLVLFLMNIGLCAVRFEVRGAMLLALWTSILFSGLLALGPQIEGQYLYFSIVLNNFSFFAIAYLGGYLGQNFSALNREVESRKRDIRTLQQLNEMIISNVANGLIAVDSHWWVTRFNTSAERLLNVQLEGKNLKEILFSEFEQIGRKAKELGPRFVSRHEVELDVVGRGLCVFEIIVSPLKDERAGDQGFVLLLQDLTQIKKMEIELRQKEKLAAVGQLAAGIAHEIRNPLASISGSIQLLASGEDKSTEESRKLMAITIKEIDRLNGLISEFLEYVRPEHAGKDVIDINQLISEILQSVKANKTLNQKVQQEVQLTSRIVIEGNRDKIKQALLNIVINAYQAMESVDKGILKVRSFDDKGYLQLVVEDNGVGIGNENLERIFEPFHTTKSNGTGLGLAVTHKILEGHGAKVSVESEVGKGTTFLIEFIGSYNPMGNEMKLMKES